jgi:hypothetical protein
MSTRWESNHKVKALRKKTFKFQKTQVPDQFRETLCHNKCFWNRLHSRSTVQVKKLIFCRQSRVIRHKKLITALSGTAFGHP